MGNKASRNPMRNRTAQRLWASVLAELVVSPERAAWIEARYPFSDVGRPGILYVEPKGSKRRAKDAPDERRPESPEQEEMEMAA